MNFLCPSHVYRISILCCAVALTDVVCGGNNDDDDDGGVFMTATGFRIQRATLGELCVRDERHQWKLFISKLSFVTFTLNNSLSSNGEAAAAAAPEGRMRGGMKSPKTHRKENSL